MNIINRFLKKNGIKSFDSDYLFVTTNNGEYVLPEEQFLVSEKNSLWNSQKTSDFIEFSLVQANQWEDWGNRIVNKVFRIHKDRIKIEEIHTPEKKAIRILDDTQFVFSIESGDPF